MNGGCSHFCDSNKCSCPSCWYLGPDLKTCGPDADKVGITCDSNDITVSIDKCVLGDQDVSKATLADGTCKAKLEGDQWIIKTDLDDCGTEFSVDTASEIIDFRVRF